MMVYVTRELFVRCQMPAGSNFEKKKKKNLAEKKLSWIDG